VEETPQPIKSSFNFPNWAVVLFLVLVPLVVLWPAIFSGKVIGPFDDISKMVPAWEQQQSNRAWDILQADGALQFYGWRDLVFEAHRTGKSPAWNPYQLGGTPLIANSQSAPFYPLHFLFGKLGLPTGFSIALLAWLHLAIGALGIRALAKRLGAGEPGAVFGAAVFALSPFAIAWTALPSVMTTCCWIPVGLACLHRSITKYTFASFITLGATVAMLCTGGHLQFTLYGLLALLLAGLIWAGVGNWKSRDHIWGSVLAIGAVLLGLAASLCQLSPVQSFSQYSHRAGAPTAEGFAAYQASSVKSYELIGLVAPGLLGAPGVPEEESEESIIPNTWSMRVKAGANYAESAIYLTVPVLLALFMIRKRVGFKATAPVIAIGLFGLALALGTGLNALLYFNIPGFSATGSPGRASILFVIAACTLAAIAIPRSSGDTNPKEKATSFFALLVVCVATILFVNTLGSLPTWIPGDSVAQSVARRLVATLPLLLVSIGLSAGAWFMWAKKAQLWAGTGLALLAHLVLAQTQILPFSTPPPAPKTPELQTRRAFINGPWDFFRATTALMPPNTATINRMQDIGGYDSLLHRDTVALLRDINTEDAAPPINGNMMFIKTKFDPEKLSNAGVTELWSRLQLPQLSEPAERKEGYFIYHLAGPGLISSPQQDAQITDLNTQGFKVTATGPGKLIARYRNIPGWIAFDNSGPLNIGGDTWIEVDLKDGPQSLTFVYIPPGSKSPIFLYLLSILALIFAVKPDLIPVRKQQSAENLVQSEEAELANP